MLIRKPLVKFRWAVAIKIPPAQVKVKLRIMAKIGALELWDESAFNAAASGMNDSQRQARINAFMKLELEAAILPL